MANYYGATRTNYFRVTDPERFRLIIENIVCEDHVDVFEKKVGEETYYGFGCYGSIDGLFPDWEEYADEHCDDPSFEVLEQELQKIIHPDDAIIITEIGHEKLRYLVAFSCIITKNSISTVRLDEQSVIEACSLLKDNSWYTQMDY